MALKIVLTGNEQDELVSIMRKMKYIWFSVNGSYISLDGDIDWSDFMIIADKIKSWNKQPQEFS